jgi:uncharacterized membrane protein
LRYALRFRLEQLGWDVAASLLVRPFALIGALAGLAEALPVLERNRVIGFPGPWATWFATEPGSAQVVLGTLAGSMMTVVSVVYTLLVVALTLASMQFSTRILTLFLRHRSTQWTLGLVAGTFAYCVLVLRSVRVDPPFVPHVALALAVALVLGSLGALVWFVHHIANGIQANHLVDRLAADTERVIDAVWPAERAAELAPPGPGGTPVHADRSGYVQLIDVRGLRALAAEGRAVVVERGMGRFVSAGAVLGWLAPHTPEAADRMRAAFDIGAVRTMQDDIEWGFRQVVDIALKAISPAVNDPSTAATCIDHLTRLLTRALRRFPPAGVERYGAGTLVVPQTTPIDLIDLAFEQLRQYGRADMAVALRLLRAFGEVAAAADDPAVRARLATHARLLESAVRPAFAPEDCDELTRRAAAVYALGGSSAGS